jgi:hypothetical protein
MKESVFTKTINITNRNVYLTNFLLIPALMYSLLGIHDIKNWKDIPKDDNLQKYLYIWYFFAGLLTSVIFFSSIYHNLMYNTVNTTLRIIGNMDHLFTAPLFSIIILIMNFIYILFLLNCESSENSYVLYFVTFVFNIIGFCSYIFKRFITTIEDQGRGRYLQKINYFMSHTFFHYMAYTGVTLLMTLYYIDNKNIYKGLFLNECIKNLKILHH